MYATYCPTAQSDYKHPVRFGTQNRRDTYLRHIDAQPFRAVRLPQLQNELIQTNVWSIYDKSGLHKHSLSKLELTFSIFQERRLDFGAGNWELLQHESSYSFGLK